MTQDAGRVVRLRPFHGKAITRRIPHPEAWADFVKLLAETLRPGDIVAISGDLGAGKTTMIQALAKELGVRQFVSSPTFALMRSYSMTRSKHGIGRMVHVDAYRLEDERELTVLDLDEELSDNQTILMIEWPEKIPRWVAAHSSVMHIDISREST